LGRSAAWQRIWFGVDQAKLLSISEAHVVKNSWIITTDSKLSINPLILNIIDLDLNKNYKLIGTINKKFINYFIWKPK